jgi:hypothetical protein
MQLAASQERLSSMELVNVIRVKYATMEFPHSKNARPPNILKGGIENIGLYIRRNFRIYTVPLELPSSWSHEHYIGLDN